MNRAASTVKIDVEFPVQLLSIVVPLCFIQDEEVVALDKGYGSVGRTLYLPQISTEWRRLFFEIKEGRI